MKWYIEYVSIKFVLINHILYKCSHLYNNYACAMKIQYAIKLVQYFDLISIHNTPVMTYIVQHTFTRIIRNVLGLSQKWHQYEKIAMIFFRADTFHSAVQSMRRVRLVIKYFVLKDERNLTKIVVILFLITIKNILNRKNMIFFVC